ncbi:phage holin family protein [uncultured Selenomonas sp.]|uniref:phage holin family protein n=1 Tax=uncultured Selenomonas sp. TaxID=159275 RepID=UPI0025F691D0|nr:phage holin family protein [uncultured Selenomonas sp.]
MKTAKVDGKLVKLPREEEHAMLRAAQGGDAFHSFIPNVTQRHIGAAASALGTTLGSLLGWNETVETLLLFMVLDYLTGLLAACISPRLRLSSARGFRGITNESASSLQKGTNCLGKFKS